eukprot:221699_1
MAHHHLTVQSSISPFIPPPLDQLSPNSDSIMVHKAIKSHEDKFHIIRLGICCMDKKLKSERVKNVLSRITAYGDIKIIPFGDYNILHRPIEQWPRCDVLIAYFSTGYPTEKVITYCDKYKPCVINDVRSQLVLRDRLVVKDLLRKNNIPTLDFALLDRNDPNHSVLEYDDRIIVNGVTIHKPFVEKPVNAEDHNIYVYYAGGGSRRLFRKVRNRSSSSSVDSCIRRQGNYFYEPFIESRLDIKVYTVGPDYAHAETRKAPTVDGIVERDVFNKEIRHKCRLTKHEKEIARKVVAAFGQNVCGFDIVRSKDGCAYVIDVNGWSFVKNNRKYFDDCSQRLRLMCLHFDKTELSPLRYRTPPLRFEMPKSNYFVDRRRMHVLRGVFGIFRHGDRTPKQKYKCSTHNETVCALIQSTKHNKLRWTYLQDSEKILNFAVVAKELYEKTNQTKWLRISEIASLNLMSIKMQFKAQERDENGCVTLTLCILKWGGELTPAGSKQCEQYAPKFRDTLLQTTPAQQDRFLANIKVFATTEVRVSKTAKEFTRVLLRQENKNEEDMDALLVQGPEVQHMLDDISTSQGPQSKKLINAAKKEIQEIFYNETLRKVLLHRKLETQYGGDSAPEITPMTANSSCNHLLLDTLNSEKISCFEKDIAMMKEAMRQQIVDDINIPSLVSRPNSNDVMDEKDLIEMAYDRVNDEMVLGDERISHAALLSRMSNIRYGLLPWARRMLKQLQDPIQKCEELYEVLRGVQRVLEENLNSNKQPYLDESPLVMKQRWDKIIEELYDTQRKQFDCSKIPDVFDSCRYDLLHNRHILRKLPLSRLWLLTELLASFVIPQEYGLSREMKLQISRGVCRPLFANIAQNINKHCLSDEEEDTPRTFLYFTSESYLHSLRNALILSDIPANKYVAADIEGMECSYFSHAVIRIFEDIECDPNSENRFYVAVAFSPGAYANPLIDVDQQIVNVEGGSPLNGRYPLNKFLRFLYDIDI